MSHTTGWLIVDICLAAAAVLGYVLFLPTRLFERNHLRSSRHPLAQRYQAYALAMLGATLATFAIVDDEVEKLTLVSIFLGGSVLASVLGWAVRRGEKKALVSNGEVPQ